MERLRSQFRSMMGEYYDSPVVLVRWALFAWFIGMVVGVVGATFHWIDEIAFTAFNENNLLVLGMPFAGLLIVWLYHVTDMADDKGTNIILVHMRKNKRIRLRTAPLIMISTALTHLTGGSAGREGAALQLGASISDYIGRVAKLKGDDTRTVKICGMAAGFAALFGTPLAAAVFAIEVARVGTMYYTALFPAVLSALVATIIANALGTHAYTYELLEIAQPSFTTIVQVVLLGLLCAAVAVIFCLSFSVAHRFYHHYTPNPYHAAFLGGVLIILLTFIIPGDYFNGTGIRVIGFSIQGQAEPLYFAFKILFTVLTLAAGFKGGEIVPALCIGASFGCVFGGLLGLPPSFGAALGMIALFCGVTNCPMASVFMAYELFGGEALPLFMLCCAVSYTMSGDGGLYTAQHIIYHKFKYEQTPKSLRGHVLDDH